MHVLRCVTKSDESGFASSGWTYRPHISEMMTIRLLDVPDIIDTSVRFSLCNIPEKLGSPADRLSQLFVVCFFFFFSSFFLEKCDDGWKKKNWMQYASNTGGKYIELHHIATFHSRECRRWNARAEKVPSTIFWYDVKRPPSAYIVNNRLYSRQSISQ